MKKGNLMSEPFTYIFIVVVIALIVFFGFKYIRDLTSFGCEVEAKKFVLDFKDKVDKVESFSAGSKTKESMYTPAGIVGVCFVDPTYSGLKVDSVKFIDVKDEVASFVDAGVLREQMFFSKSLNSNDKCVPDRTRIENFKVANGITCFDTSVGSFTFFLENKGKYVEISNK